MTRRLAILFILVVPAWFCAVGAAEAVSPKKRALALLKPVGKRTMTETEAKEVASLGPDILPTVYDALWSTNEFQGGHWAAPALRVLAYTGNSNVVPRIKQFLESNSNRYQQYLAARAILEITNTPDAREYVVGIVNHWIATDKDSINVGLGFNKLLDAKIPKRDMVEMLNRITFDRTVDQRMFFGQLAGKADEVSISVLKHNLQSGDTNLVAVIEKCIPLAIKTLQARDESCTHPDYNPDDAQAFPTQQEVDRIHTDMTTRIERLRKEFPTVIK